jgi:isoquinoline 1-oxidoreductase subunit beta
LVRAALLGGGLILGFNLPVKDPSGGAATKPTAPIVPDAFIRIASDETVTFIINRSEMGQGVYTSLPMLIAEELECDWAKVRVDSAPVAHIYNHTACGMQMTGGNTSVWSEYVRLRKVGAAAREMLVTAAARAWRVSSAVCRAENGIVIGPAGKQLTYGQLAERASKLPVPRVIKLKEASHVTLIGKPTK